MPILLTCEHGGNHIPPAFRKNFKAAGEVLKTHRGLDIGALVIAKHLQKLLKSPLVFSTTSRLLVDLNRTLQNPTLFSEFTKDLSKATKASMLAKYYFPHWKKVRTLVSKMNKRHEDIIHIAVHSMTDNLNGQKRRMHLALLYNPKYKNEVKFSSQWIKELRKEFPEFIIARNKPYRGDGDGLTCELRKENKNYIGIELEMNQAMLQKMNERQKRDFAKRLAKSLVFAKD